MAPEYPTAPDPQTGPGTFTGPGEAVTDGTEQQRCRRPWGWFETLAEGEGYRVKRLVLHAGQRLSLQRHRHRCEHWLVASGSGLLELDGQRQPLVAGSSATIAQGAVHRASAGAQDLEIIELQRGSLLSEDDIERLADDYGRSSPPTPALAGAARATDQPAATAAEAVARSTPQDPPLASY